MVLSRPTLHPSPAIPLPRHPLDAEQEEKVLKVSVIRPVPAPSLENRGTLSQSSVKQKAAKIFNAGQLNRRGEERGDQDAGSWGLLTPHTPREASFPPCQFLRTGTAQSRDGDQKKQSLQWTHLVFHPGREGHLVGVATEDVFAGRVLDYVQPFGAN